MIVATLLMAGTCAWMPSYSTFGAVCSAADQAIECKCDECFSWVDPMVGTTSAADYFVVQRTDMDGTVHVKSTRTFSFTDEGFLVPPPTTYCPAKDDDYSMPLEGRTYKYAVWAVNSAGVSVATPQVVYVAAPYAINQFRPPIKGN